jgi:beta-lactamase regulating signal transducer with metallopeptidase domain
MIPIFKVILISSIYASFVGIIILIFKTVLRNKISPKWHYIIWVVLVLKLIIPFGPASMISLFNAVPQLPQETSFNQQYEEFHKSMNLMRQEKPHLPNTWQVKEASLSLAAAAENSFPYIWGSGAVFILGWLIYINFSLYKKLMKDRKCVPQLIASVFEECKRKVNVKRNIEIILQDTINTPAILGLINPKILLPSTITTLEARDISYILLHELTHYKRKDLFVNYMLIVLQAVHWFNPVIWYCFNRIRQDMELAADESVLLYLNSSEQKEYGKALLTVLEKFSQQRFAPRFIGMINDKKDIKRRINFIKMAELFKSKRRIVVVIGVLCIAILSGILLTNALPEKAKVDADAQIKLETLNSGYAGPGEYPKNYPKLTISSGETSIDWIRGDASFTDDPRIIIGNSNFGADAEYAKAVLKPAKLKFGALINFKSDEVKGFAKPKYKISICDENGNLKQYNSNENSISTPFTSGKYLYNLSVVWENTYYPNIHNDNIIEYWFFVSVENK